MDTIDVEGLRVAYERAGEGPNLVLLHGYVGDGPTTWRPQLEALSERFTVVAWDAPGAGRSSDPPEDFGMCGLRRLPGRVHRPAGTGPAARCGPVLRRRAGSRLRSPASCVTGSLVSGIRLRRLGRLAAGRGRRRPLAAGGTTGRRRARGVTSAPSFRPCSPRGHAGRGRRRVRRGHAIVPPRRVPGHGACLRRRPASLPAHRRRPDPCSCTARATCGLPCPSPRAPRRHQRLDPRRAARRRPRLQHRRTGRVQRRSSLASSA